MRIVSDMNILIDSSIENEKLVESTVKELKKAGYNTYSMINLQDTEKLIQEDLALEDIGAIVVLVSQDYLDGNYPLLQYSWLKPKLIPIVLDDSVLPGFFNDLISYRLKYNYDVPQYVPHLLNKRGIKPTKKIDKKVAEPANLDKDFPSCHNSENQEKYYEMLNRALADDQLTLVCGAGVSISSGILAWNDLLNSMFIDVLRARNSADAVKLDELFSAIPHSNIILAKYLKLHYKDRFEEVLSRNLYSKVDKDFEKKELIKSIVDLCRPKRNRTPVNSIITYNFDDLIERALKDNRIDFTPIWQEGQKAPADSLPIYHVHGYLPDKKNIESPNLVFSEEAYHSQFIDPYSWGNIQQLNAFSSNVCLFVGISLSDPNLRRLLDVSWRKNHTNPHFIIMRKTDKKMSCHKVADDLFEADARALGLNVIWCEEYEEIPGIISKIGP